MKNKFIKLIWLTFILFFTFMLVSCSSSSKVSSNVHIASVHDGDTFKDDQNNTYRLFGVDTPEVSNQYKGFEMTQGIEQIYAQYATTLTRSMIENKEVSVQTKGVDVYHRIVAKISVKNLDLAYELIAKGLARVAYFDVIDKKSPYFSDEYSYYESLVWAQKRAFDQHLGVWRDSDEFKVIFPKS